MNILLLKQIGLFSVLIGLIIGAITPIPIIGPFVFTMYFLALSAGIIIYLKKNNILGDITVKEGGIIGAVIGFTSFIALACVFIPISALCGFIFHDFLGRFIADCFTGGLTFVLLIFLLFLFALLCALMNGFTGAVTAYVYEVLAELQKEENNTPERNNFNIK
ncbi:MAG: hypothetical protein NC200_03025 [Candidatus Gastranaerophilales bacterium]|nr:hypothetical protein [Candidatus Gastranaerophilales bacterium]